LKRKLLLGIVGHGTTYSTSLSHLKLMTGEDAVKQFDDDPTKLWVMLGDIVSLFGMTIEELHADLIDGKLKAHFLDEGGKQSIAVNAEELMRWMTITGRSSIDPS
jgi:hypothetical protein